MKIKKGAELQLQISDMAIGGKGLVKVDGFAIFVDQAVPLDEVLIRIVKKKKKYAEAKVVELIKPSPFRIQPQCEYSGFCGGCKWQFLNYEQQLVYKQQHVKDAMEHIGMIHGIKIFPVLGSENIFAYRNKMEFSCSDRRWLLPKEMGTKKTGLEGRQADFGLGLHVPGTFYKVLDIKACLLQPDLGNLILDDIRDFIKKSSEPVYGLRSHEGFWRFVMLRHSVAFNQWMVNIITKSYKREVVQPLAELLVGKYPVVASVINNVTDSKAGVAVGKYEVCLAGVSSIREKIASFEFEISANSFFQTNTKGAKQLYDVVKEYAQLSGREIVWDLYCGTGTIGIFLAKDAQKVFGFEMVESSILDAKNNCAKNSITNCEYILGDIRFNMAKLTKKPDVIIIDPPRSGMHKNVVKQILEIAPGRIVYVSCNPATMARDINLLYECYDISKIQPVDMFPHTYHIESVALLNLRSSTQKGTFQKKPCCIQN